MKQYEEALRELQVSRNHFENCDSDFFDIANKELTIALKKVDLILEKMKVLNKLEKKKNEVIV